MTPIVARRLIVVPTLEWLGRPFDSVEARVLLLAIGMQETRFEERDQGDSAIEGPALGFWQFEKPAVADFFARGTVLLRSRAGMLMADLPATPIAAWHAIGQGADHLACILARDLLWRGVRSPLPALGDIDGAYAQYLKAWRPGKPSRDRWTTAYAQAIAAQS